MAFRKKRKDPFREIQACLQKRDYKGALDWFHTLLQKDKKNTQIRLRFADTLVLAGSKQEAVKQYRIVADELAEKGFMIRAIAINKKILQLDPNQTDVHQKLAAMSEERSGSRADLASALSPPGPGAAPGTEARPETAPPVEPRSTPEAPEAKAPVPELSLEESMAMEFGTAGEDTTSEPESLKEPVVAEEESAAAAETPTASGFELLEAKEELSPRAGEEAPSFSEEPLELEPETPPPSAEPEHEPAAEIEGEEEEIEIVALEEGGGPEVEPSVDEVEEPAGESTEIVLDVEAEPAPGSETDEELEVVELDVETEPAMAAEGETSLVSALGEDIDSLIDSIIDDVGSPAGRQLPRGEPPTHIPLFSDLTTAEFIDVALLLVRRVAKMGETIVREGDPGDSMFIISTGEVRATVHSNGEQMTVATLKDGDFFGEMAVLSGEPRTATVTAVKSTELLELSRENLREICSRHPHVEAKLRLAYDERTARAQTRS